jgi:hypothetical protein
MNPQLSPEQRAADLVHHARPRLLVAEPEHLPRSAMGRGQETYREDPFLTGRMGVAYVTGLQGDDPKDYLAIATPNHFAVHGGP